MLLRKPLTKIAKHTVYQPSTLPFRVGSQLAAGWVLILRGGL